MPFLLQLNTLLIKNKNSILTLFRAAEVGMLLFWLIRATLFLNGMLEIGPLYQLGSKLGVLALGLYCLTLVPGILQRFQVLPILSAMLTPFKRHLGISMFVAAFVHMSFTTTLPIMKSGVFDPSTVPLFSMMGSFAWWLLLPLWLTSNDFSQRKLGRYWKMLHRLTYIALFLIYLHVALQVSEYRVVALSFLVAEVASWVWFWWKKRATSQASVA